MAANQQGTQPSRELVIPQVSSTPVDRHNCLPAEAVGRAMRLAAAVHDEGPAEVAAILRRLTRQDIVELAVVLAAMTPVDYSPAELLAWNDCRWARPAPSAAPKQAPLFPVVAVSGQLRPHGTHAAYVRHRAHNEEPCDPCKHGEREYQRERGRRRRRTAVEKAS